jgi:hypothetical protein
MSRLLVAVVGLFAVACGNSNSKGGQDMAVSSKSDLSVPAGRDLATGPVAPGTPATQVQQRYFPDSAPWYTDVTNASPAPDSGAITSWMVSHSGPNGWGTGTMKVDFSILSVEVPAGTPKLTYQTSQDFYYSPDCDTAPIPLAPGGAVEQSYGSDIVFTSPFSGYSCAGFGGGDDCHILLVARSENRLYEVYHGTATTAADFTVGCLAIWDTTNAANPPPGGRGQQCTSADAAGFPMSALLFSAEEIKAGSIDHAIRFILPNDMIRAQKYVSPATHGTATSGPATSGPYGFHMRLKPGSYSSLSAGAQVVAKALQKYGMYMSDGGNIALTAQNDVLSTTKWSDVGFDASSLSSLKATDFDVLDYGTVYDVGANGGCNRTAITQ